MLKAFSVQRFIHPSWNSTGIAATNTTTINIIYHRCHFVVTYIDSILPIKLDNLFIRFAHSTNSLTISSITRKILPLFLSMLLAWYNAGPLFSICSLLNSFVRYHSTCLCLPLHTLWNLNKHTISHPSILRWLARVCVSLSLFLSLFLSFLLIHIEWSYFCVKRVDITIDIAFYHYKIIGPCGLLREARAFVCICNIYCQFL